MWKLRLYQRVQDSHRNFKVVIIEVGTPSGNITTIKREEEQEMGLISSLQPWDVKQRFCMKVKVLIVYCFHIKSKYVTNIFAKKIHDHVIFKVQFLIKWHLL